MGQSPLNDFAHQAVDMARRPIRAVPWWLGAIGYIIALLCALLVLTGGWLFFVHR